MLDNIYYVLIWVFAAWHYALRCGYISDDHSMVERRKDIIPDAEKNPKIEKSYWVNVFNDGVILYYTDRLLRKLGFKNVPFVWHLVSLAVHIVNVYLVWLVLTPIIGQETALVAAFLWGINPMLNQNVVWVSGRPYSFAAMLGLICMLFWDKPYIVLPLYAIAVITNLSVAAVPALIAMLHPSWQGTLYVGVMLGCGVPFVAWKFYKRFTAALVLDRENFKINTRKIHGVVRIYLYYIWTAIVPTKMGWYHTAGFRYNHKWNKFNVYTLMGYIAIWLMIRQGFLGWWWILGMLPNVNLFATNSFVQDRYMYFGSIGLAAIIAHYFVPYPELLLVVGTFYAVRSYMYTRQLINDEAMYRENWRNHPTSDYAVNNLSFFLIQQKRFDEARVIILRALQHGEKNKMLWYNLGVTWAATGHFQNDEGKFRFLRAVDCWRKCLEIEPRWRKPADDLKKLLQVLMEKKVITTNPKESAPGASMTIPGLGSLIKT